MKIALETEITGSEEVPGQPPRADKIAQTLTEKIRSRSARVGIVGLGYVGLPLAVEFAKAGFDVTGIDLSETKVAKVNAGESYIADISSDEFRN